MLNNFQSMLSKTCSSETRSFEYLFVHMLPFPDCPDPSRTVSNKYERKPEYVFIEICDMLDV